jgi:hypothetical protein
MNDREFRETFRFRSAPTSQQCCRTCANCVGGTLCLCVGAGMDLKEPELHVCDKWMPVGCCD